MDLEGITFRRRMPLRLQLAPMIDIFTLLIVFLLKSTVVADISIIFPSELVAPKSFSKESLETFPEVFVYSDRIEMPFLGEKRSISSLADIDGGELSKLKGKVEAYIRSATGESKQNVININVLSSRENSYKNIYESVKFLRQIGFQTVLFIAEGESK